MAKQGSLLEKNVERIFSLAGFETSRNVKRESYEIDVLATHRNLKIAIECKERDNGPLTVRNLIHEWAGKKRYINVDKVLIVIYGPSVSSKDMELAEKEKIEIWDSDKFEKYLDLSHELKEKSLPLILKDLGISTKEVEELNRKIETDVKRENEENEELKKELDKQTNILYNKIPLKRREKIEDALEQLINRYEGKDSINEFINFTEKKGIFSSFRNKEATFVRASCYTNCRVYLQLWFLADENYYDFQRYLLENEIIPVPTFLEFEEIEVEGTRNIFVFKQKNNIKIITVLIELCFRYCHPDGNYDVNVEFSK